jgi:glucuronate isomerase
MKPFMDDDFLLSNDTAKTLYHNYAKQVPIIDLAEQTNGSWQLQIARVSKIAAEN